MTTTDVSTTAVAAVDGVASARPALGQAGREVPSAPEAAAAVPAVSSTPTVTPMTRRGTRVARRAGGRPRADETALGLPARAANQDAAAADDANSSSVGGPAAAANRSASKARWGASANMPSPSGCSPRSSASTWSSGRGMSVTSGDRPRRALRYSPAVALSGATTAASRWSARC